MWRLVLVLFAGKNWGSLMSEQEGKMNKTTTAQIDRALIELRAARSSASFDIQPLICIAIDQLLVAKKKQEEAA